MGSKFHHRQTHMMMHISGWWVIVSFKHKKWTIMDTWSQAHGAYSLSVSAHMTRRSQRITHVVTELQVLLRAHNILSRCIIQEPTLFGLYVACYSPKCTMAPRPQRAAESRNISFLLVAPLSHVCSCQYSLSGHAGGIACLISDWRVNELQPGDL